MNNIILKGIPKFFKINSSTPMTKFVDKSQQDLQLEDQQIEATQMMRSKTPFSKKQKKSPQKGHKFLPYPPSQSKIIISSSLTFHSND